MTSAAGMPCPICRVGLVMSERQGVEIDYCPQCRGVWLDRGELDKIIERASREMEAAAPPPQAPYPQPQPPQHSPFDPYAKRSYADYGHDYKYKKRKKSFFEELFD
ncbi:MAG TPA: zf-TFIIB domain-containing protein [Pedomonas sp.]|uniref:TFIIB-type zinc ribbon-containing protein n=1 Tax=Pedomonas sp. TaxID=2976421 RepID=UPI002F3F1CCD